MWRPFASSQFQDMTSQICLHSKKYDSFSLSNLKEEVSVSCYKQEELLVVFVSNYSKSHVALTKQRMHFGFQQTQEQSWIEIQAEEALLTWNSSMRSIQKKWKRIFLPWAERRAMMMTCRWFVCYSWINAQSRAEGPLVTLSRVWAFTKQNTFLFIVSSSITPSL